MNTTRRTASVVFALLLQLGCSEPPRASETQRDPEAELRARFDQQWELTRLGTQKIPSPPEGTPVDAPGHDLVPGRRPTIRFTSSPPGAGGRSFCNGYGGPFTMKGDSLRFGQIVSSAVGCDRGDSLETRFFRGLRETRTFTVDSATLVLIGDDGPKLTFARTKTSPGYP